jgi:S-adenosylmethionine hydrolase
VHDPARVDLAATPQVVHVDRFGNLVTNVPAAAFAGVRGVRVAGRMVARARTYGDVCTGDLLAYVGSYGLVEVAQNGGSASRVLEVGRGAPVELVPA